MQQIENKTERIYKKGELLFKENDPAPELFIIQSGQVRVFRTEKDKVFELGKFGKGSVIGEMALFDNNPRSATAEAATDTRVLYVDKQHFAKQLEKVPGWLSAIITIIIKRLRDTTKRMKDDTLDDYLVSTAAWILYYIYDRHKVRAGRDEGLEMHLANKIICGIMDIKADLLAQCYDILVKKQVIRIEKGVIIIPSLDVVDLFVKYKKEGMAGLLGVELPDRAVDLLRHLATYARKFGRARGRGMEVDLEDFKIELEKTEGKGVNDDDLVALAQAKLIGRRTDDQPEPPKEYIALEDKDKIRVLLEKFEMVKAFK